MEFKEKLKKFRTDNGLSQEALADAVHISRSAIAKYENGNGNPSEETLKALAVYFGVEVDELRSDQTVRKNKNNKTLIKAGTIAFAILPVWVKELVNGYVKQSDDLVKGVQARMLAPVLHIHNGARGTVYKLCKIFLRPTFCLSFALDLPA